jgi:hypothetical protein
VNCSRCKKPLDQRPYSETGSHPEVGLCTLCQDKSDDLARGYNEPAFGDEAWAGEEGEWGSSPPW